MKVLKILVFLSLFLGQGGYATAAFIKNSDSTPQSIVIIEASHRRDITIAANEDVGICPKGCFVTFPNGDRFYIKSGDSIEINDNRASFK